MNKAINSLRLFLCFFSGEDDYIIRRCGTRIQISFASIGFFVIIIFVGCWTSASLFLSHLFEGTRWLSIPVGILWGLLVANLYLLLLYTISPALLPNSKKRKEKRILIMENNATKSESPFTASLIFRLSIILLLAIIITQPLNVLIFSPSFDESKYYAREIRNILSSHSIAWLITIIGCIIFLLPIYWKYRIRNRSEFYERKKIIESQIVLDSYIDFKSEYATIFEKKITDYNRTTWENLMPLLNKLETVNPRLYNVYFEHLKKEIINEPIAKYEYWADHPFRTTLKKKDKNSASEEDFLKTIYPTTS
jgi:hypothetical protein